ncbi:MAG: ABC transporter ATP-binding protein [Rhodospirillales bacterium]|nr:ABC transporter ATP-binding protein [Rhodospirillales bacterium]
MSGSKRETVVSARDLTKRFDSVTAISSLSFAIDAGSTTAFLGGNGAGKTTTLSILLGLLLPTSGSVTIFGEDMLRHRYRVLPRMNFSSPYVDMPRRLTVRENLNVYANLYGVNRARERVQSVARDMEVVEFLDRPTGILSAGQKTRVALAKALLNEPDLLLLDEPTASLDPDTGDWVRGHLEAYKRRTGATIVLASHNMAEVERLADMVLMMKNGAIVDRGSPRELISRFGCDTLEQVFLDIARKRDSAARSAS